MLDALKKTIESLTKDNSQLESALLTGTLSRYWKHIFEGPIAKNSWPTSIRNRVLYVETGSPAWAQQLDLMKGELIKKLNSFLGQEKIVDLRFKPGGKREKEHDREKSWKRLSSKDQSEKNVNVEDLIKEQEVWQKSLMKAGGKLCRECGLVFLGKEPLCRFCSREKTESLERKIRQLFDQAPWLNFQEAKKEIGQLEKSEYDRLKKEKRDQLIQRLYQLSWGALESGFEARSKDEMQRVGYAYAMLKNGTRPKDTNNLAVEKALPAKVRIVWLKTLADTTHQI